MTTLFAFKRLSSPARTQQTTPLRLASCCRVTPSTGAVTIVNATLRSRNSSDNLTKCLGCGRGDDRRRRPGKGYGAVKRCGSTGESFVGGRARTELNSSLASPDASDEWRRSATRGAYHSPTLFVSVVREKMDRASCWRTCATPEAFVRAQEWPWR